jgi:hypothetical protein
MYKLWLQPDLILRLGFGELSTTTITLHSYQTYGSYRGNSLLRLFLMERAMFECGMLYTGVQVACHTQIHQFERLYDFRYVFDTPVQVLTFLKCDGWTKMCRAAFSLMRTGFPILGESTVHSFDGDDVDKPARLYLVLSPNMTSETFICAVGRVLIMTICICTVTGLGNRAFVPTRQILQQPPGPSIIGNAAIQASQEWISRHGVQAVLDGEARRVLTNAQLRVRASQVRLYHRLFHSVVSNESEQAQKSRILQLLVPVLCPCGAPGLRVCSGCMYDRYCSVACQRRSWPAHKSRCQTLRHAKLQGKVAIKPTSTRVQLD